MSVDLDFSQDYFALFGLPVGFEIEMGELSHRYRKLQAALHPDRFVNASDQERRLSVQGAAWINEAFETLKNPLERAKYLLHLKGITFDADKDTASDPAFLMQQMELREQMEEIEHQADPYAALDALASEIRDWNRSLFDAFVVAYNAGELETAREQVLKLKFFGRLFDEIRRREEQLDDQL